MINLNVTDKPEWYFSKHYQGKAPAIEYNGKVVIESLYIPEYLDDVFPESRLLPTDPYEKVQQKLLVNKLDAVRKYTPRKLNVPNLQVGNAVPLLFATMRDRTLKDEKQVKVFEVLKMAEDLLTDVFFAGSVSE